MKKVLLFALATSVALSSFAQRSKTSLSARNIVSPHYAARTTTATGDTVEFGHILSTDTTTFYGVGANGDSGIVTGTDAYGDKGFAERYITYDTLVSVIGVITEFTGNVSSTSTKTVSLNAWKIGAQTPADATAFPSGHWYNSGFPAASIASMDVPVTQLGIGNGAADTVKMFYFPTASSYVPGFFVGYTINYTFASLNGDTLGLICSKDGERHFAIATVSGTDTIIQNVNATQFADGSWHDNATDNFLIANHLFVFPLVIWGGPNAVNAVTKNNLTFYSAYPNPAVNETNIKFALNQGTTVTVQITDLSGKVVKTISDKYTSGTHVVTVPVNELAAGEYIYLVRTAEGDGMASKFAVIK